MEANTDIAASEQDVKVKNRCWNAYITSCLRDLYKRAELCDAVLIVSTHSTAAFVDPDLPGKQTFPVHKCVVGSVSPYLRSLFKGEPKENEHCVPLVSPAGLRHVLDFIYSGESNVPIKEVDEVYRAALVLQVESLSFQVKKAYPSAPYHWDQLKGNILSQMLCLDKGNFLTPPRQKSPFNHSNHSSDKQDSLDDLSQVHHNGLCLNSESSERLVKSELCSLDTGPVFPGQEERRNESVFPQPEPVITIEPSEQPAAADISNHNEETQPDKKSPSKHLQFKAEDHSTGNNPNDSMNIANPESSEWPSQPEQKTPIVIEPSMAYSLFEMAQKHQSCGSSSLEESRYGITVGE